MDRNQHRVQINILPVHEGDCIHLRFQSSDGWHNIVVDSGPAASAETFRNLMDSIRKRGECVDLLCFSHMDDDHIKGAEMTFRENRFQTSHIKNIWLNVPDSAVPSDLASNLPTYQYITAESAFGLIKIIHARKIPCVTKVTEGDCLTIGNIPITAVLPSQKRLTAYYRKFDKDMEKLRQNKPYLFIGGRDLDTSPFNGSSITLMIDLFYGKVLLCGDSFARDLADAVGKYALNEEILLVKLPHHGSDRNISRELLEKLKCKNYIISTETDRGRPSQNTINLLATYGNGGNGVMLYGNYPWPLIRKPNRGIEIIKLSGRRRPSIADGIAIYTEG